MRNNIVLIGMPGSGKSTVGVVLAKSMGMGFVDVDLVICQQNGGSLQEIVDRNTHEGFLQLENDAALSIHCENSVIATGGSMVYSREAMEYLKSIATVVYIKVPFKDLDQRIDNMSTRGIAFSPGETLWDLYVGRTPMYEEWADITVESSNRDRVEAVARRIKSELK